MKSLSVSLCILILVVGPTMALAGPTAALAGDAVSLGDRKDTQVVPARTDSCGGALPYVHHDGTFEGGIAWSSGGVVPPYYGAFGEGYSLGRGTLACGAYWLTQIGYYHGETADLYVWQGGFSGEPGEVLAMVPGIVFQNIPGWPLVGRNDMPLDVQVQGEFTAGYWGNWPGLGAAYFCAVDMDGPAGRPWTYVAPDVGGPSGWQDPSIAWGYHISSLGLGVYFRPEAPTPVPVTTWGRIKALYL